MSEVRLSVLNAYQATTFQERGVAIPFTTPLLAGTRARQTDRQGIELVLPNLSGGRGFYVMPWTNISSWCQLTLHDTAFTKRFADLRIVTPATIHNIALQIAADGLAGDKAMIAARLALDAEDRDRAATSHWLLMTLVEQVRNLLFSSAAVKGRDKMNLMAEARLTVDWISDQLDQPPTWTASALKALSELMSNIGPNSGNVTGRLPALLTLLRQTRIEISRWNNIQQKNDEMKYAGLVCAAADLTLAKSQTTLAHAQALTNDMVNLLRAWAMRSSSIITSVNKPEWLIDGWEQICFIWKNAQDDVERRTALVEISRLIPILPREANEWAEIETSLEKNLRFRRLVPLNEDWRTGKCLPAALEIDPELTDNESGSFRGNVGFGV